MTFFRISVSWAYTFGMAKTFFGAMSANQLAAAYDTNCRFDPYTSPSAALLFNDTSKCFCVRANLVHTTDFDLKEKCMKYVMCNNDCHPSVEVLTDGDELLVRFWGFAYDEAQLWFNSKAVMDSLEVWHSVIGDFEITVTVKGANTVS